MLVSRESDANETSSGLANGVSGRGQDPVRVEREPVGGRGLEAAAAARGELLELRVDAAERAQERERAVLGVLAAELVAARGQRADQHLGAGVCLVHQRVRAADERAVQVRRHRRAALADAARLRHQPAGEVRLVPEDVAVDAVAVALGHRARELAVELRIGVIARLAPLGAPAHPQRTRAGDVEHRLHPGRDHAVDRVVERRPVVGAAGVVGRDPAPQREDPHLLDAHVGPLGDRLVGQRAAGEQDAVVGDPQFRPGGVGGGGEEEEGGEDGERQAHVDGSNAVCSPELRCNQMMATTTSASARPGRSPRPRASRNGSCRASARSSSSATSASI